MKLTKGEQERVVEILELHSGLFGNEREECLHLMKVVRGEVVIENYNTSLSRILNGVSLVSGISIEDIRSRSRKRDIVMARSYAVYQGFESVYLQGRGLSVKRLGEFFGLKDHASALSAKNRISGWLKSGDKLTVEIHNAYLELGE